MFDNRKVEFVNFKGKCRWARVHQPDVKFDSWNIAVWLTPNSIEKFKELQKGSEGIEGIKNELKTSEDGIWHTFKRPCTRKWQGVDTKLPPPVVVDKDNKYFSGDIGDGSDVTVRCEVYQYTPRGGRRGTAMRLVGVRIDNLVPKELSSLEQEHIDAMSKETPSPAIVGWNED